MQRVYVAGAYSADNVMDVLNNIRRGIKASTEVFLSGFAPFCPWLDFHYQLMLGENEILTIDNYYEYSISWLKVSDIMYVISNWQSSKGTIEEIKFANEERIPVVYSMQELKKLKI